MFHPIKSMTRRAAAVLALLVLIGFLGNYFALPLFFGADFIFGSVAVLLVLYFYGLGWGLVAAVLVNSYTYVLWGHPYGFIVFILEAQFVGYFLHAGRRNLFLLDGLFWLLIGLPLNAVLYYVVMHMDATTTSFIMLKQGINGIFNALLASLAINYLPLDRLVQRSQARRTFSLQETIFYLLVALVLFPALLLTLMEIKDEMRQIEKSMMAELQTMSNDIQSHLHSWYQQHLRPVTELALMAGKSTMTPSGKLQYDTEMLKKSFPDFHTLHVENDSGTTIACSPAVNKKGSAIGVNLSDRPWFKEVKATHRVVLSEVFWGERVSLSPIAVIGIPILKGNQFLGAATAALDLNRVKNIIEPYGKNRNVSITLTDSGGRVIASTAAERPPLLIWDRKRDGVVRRLSATLYSWSPADENLPTMTRWKRSFFVQETKVGDNIPWTLVLEAPIAPHQQRLYAIYVQNLTVMAVLAALSMLVALALSRWLTGPLGKLAKVTTDLPDKIMQHQDIAWPESSATEMDSLIGNFQSMTQALERNFQDLEEHGKELAKTNEELKIEMSERALAEKALRDSEDKYRSLVNNASEGILLADLDGNFLEANQRMAELLSYTVEEILRLNVADIYPKEDLERTMAVFKEIVRTGEGSLLNGWIVRQDGAMVPVDITGRKVEFAGKTIIQKIFKDLTDRQKTEAERLRFSKLESLGTLAGGIAHDFNNILTAILGNVSLAILDPSLNGKTRERLTMSEKACQQAHALAQQLLTFAKGGATIKKIVSLQPLLKESATLTLAGSKARCEISAPADLWSVKVDVAQINQVISNLLINAEQAMPAGGTIKISAENLEVGEGFEGLPLTKGKYVKLSIADAGVGIEPKYLDKIFDPYFTTKQKGSGLGLAVAYAIIKNNAGYITVDSTMGLGSTFHVFLPATEVSTVSEDRKPTKIHQGQGRVLVMDDEEIVREVVGKMLGHLGYEVDFAKDGAEAIDLYAKAKESGQPFTAVILDLTIPGGMGGKEAIQKLLGIDPEVKALVSSGYSDDLVIADFKKYGFSSAIQKPYRIAELSKTLGEVVEFNNNN